MKNILIVLIPFLVILLSFLVAIIVLFIKRPKHYWFINITLTILIIVNFIYLRPYFQDLTQGEVRSYIGTYIDNYYTGNALFCNVNTFQNDSSEIKVYIPRILYRSYNLEEGQIYKIEYFLQTRIVKDIQLIEQK